MEQFSKTSNRCTSQRKRVSNSGAICEFDQNEDTFSVYFDEQEHYFIENGQKEHTGGISNSREISRLWFKK